MKKNYKEKFTRRLSKLFKALIYSIRKPCKKTVPVFILGCGRSGTTMMIDIFHRDLKVESLDENNPKIAINYLLDYEKVSKAVANSKASVIAMKPILNSFEALYILNRYDNAKAIWLLRDYKDMVSSSIKKFGNTVSNYIKDYTIEGKNNNWLSMGMHDDTRKVISSMDVAGYTEYDWMALVWWSVNRTVLLDKLYESKRFILIKYETLVNKPIETTRNIYRFIGLNFNNKNIKYVHPASVGKGKSVKLKPEIKSKCNELAEELGKFCFYES